MSILDGFYPGSREKRQTVPLPAAAVPEDRLGPGTIMSLGGKDVEFYTIGQVAAAIGRKPNTLRKWETLGVLPKTPYRTRSDDPRAKRRLYTRAQAEGILRVVMDMNIMDPRTRFDVSMLRDRLWDMFSSLREA